MSTKAEWKKPLTAAAQRYKVIASFQSAHGGQISVNIGDLVVSSETPTPDGFLFVRKDVSVGLVPLSSLEVIRAPIPPSVGQAQAVANPLNSTTQINQSAEELQPSHPLVAQTRRPAPARGPPPNRRIVTEVKEQNSDLVPTLPQQQQQSGFDATVPSSSEISIQSAPTHSSPLMAPPPPPPVVRSQPSFPRPQSLQSSSEQPPAQPPVSGGPTKSFLPARRPMIAHEKPFYPPPERAVSKAVPLSNPTVSVASTLTAPMTTSALQVSPQTVAVACVVNPTHPLTNTVDPSQDQSITDVPLPLSLNSNTLEVKEGCEIPVPTPYKLSMTSPSSCLSPESELSPRALSDSTLNLLHRIQEIISANKARSGPPSIPSHPPLNLELLRSQLSMPPPIPLRKDTPIGATSIVIGQKIASTSSSSSSSTSVSPSSSSPPSFSSSPPSPSPSTPPSDPLSLSSNLPASPPSLSPRLTRSANSTSPRSSCTPSPLSSVSISNVSILSNGQIFFKYSKKSKAPRFVFLDRSQQDSIKWREVDRGRIEGSILVKDIRSILVGGETNIEKRHPKVGSESHLALSIFCCSPEIALQPDDKLVFDVIADTLEIRDLWFNALNSLLPP